MGEYDNPGEAFLKSISESKSPDELISDYAQFLLKKADIDRLPVNLQKILDSFNIKDSKIEQAGNRRGLSQPDFGVILLNQEDKETVQRFTMAHELMEILLSIYEPGGQAKLCPGGESTIKKKEKLCDKGAAELLMPMNLFKEEVKERNISLDTARGIAHECKTSLTATIKRIVNTNLKKILFVIWRYTTKPSKSTNSAKDIEPLIAKRESVEPSRDLRVCHVTSSANVDEFIPYGKSIKKNTNVYEAYGSCEVTKGYDYLDLANLKGSFYVESLPSEIGNERYVMSLIHLDRKKIKENKLSNFL